jgi:hypothetical protein
MLHSFVADDRFFGLLAQEDARVAALVKGAGCHLCGGRLDQANYPRKPRGGAIGAVGEGQVLRSSFCCCREGCRRRATPPSLVFLGRRVYLAIVVLVETLRRNLAPSTPPPAVAAPSRSVAPSPTAAPSPPPLPSRTVKRWQRWFEETLPTTQTFEAARGWLWPPVCAKQLPQALVERFEPGRSLGEALWATLRFLSPLTTTTSGVIEAAFLGGE